MTHDKAMNQRLKVGSGGNSRSSVFFNQRLLKYFAPSFSIIASKKKTSASFLDQLIDHAIRQLAAKDSRYGNARIRDVLVSSGKIIALVDISDGSYSHNKKPGFVIKIPLTPYGEHRLERNSNILEGIWSHMPVLASMVTYVPRKLLRASLAGQTYFVEDLRPGVCAESLRLSASERTGFMRSAIDVLTQFQTATMRCTRIHEAVFKELFINPILEVADFLEYERESHTLTRIISMLRKTMLGVSLPLVWSHGDFSLKNFTATEAPLRTTGLIDWDLSRPVSLPLLDCLHLIARERIVDERLTLHGVLRKCLFPLASGDLKNDLLSNYLETVSINRSVIPALCIMYWISRLHGHIGSLNDLEYSWRDKNFVAVAEDISQQLC
jgi:hypothetical protein